MMEQAWINVESICASFILRIICPWVSTDPLPGGESLAPPLKHELQQWQQFVWKHYVVGRWWLENDDTLRYRCRCGVFAAVIQAYWLTDLLTYIFSFLWNSFSPLEAHYRLQLVVYLSIHPSVPFLFPTNYFCRIYCLHVDDCLLMQIVRGMTLWVWPFVG